MHLELCVLSWMLLAFLQFHQLEKDVGRSPFSEVGLSVESK